MVWPALCSNIFRMGSWSIDTVSEPGVVRIRLEGVLTEREAAEYVVAHNRAIDSIGTSDYKVWVDMTALEPLSQESGLIIEQAKRYSQAHVNFRGSSVLVSRATVGLQQRITSIRSGVLSTEMISDDPAALREHLRTVYRRSE
jgi:hypothetical protein